MNKSFAILAVLLVSGCSVATRQPDPIYRETIVRHERPAIEGERFDPQEFDPQLKETFAEADRRAEKMVGNVERNNDFVQTFWKAKKRILEKKFAITWSSPADLNPEIQYGNYGQPEVTPLERESIFAIIRSRLDAGETVVAIWREFKGEVWLTTRLEGREDTKYFVLVGHDQTWEVKSTGYLIY